MIHKKRILIVDDNPDLAENLAEIFQGDGVEALVAAGGREGVEFLRERGEFDLVVTDMRMPGFSGLDVVCHIQDEYPTLPVVVLTAYARDELLERARAAGALSIFAKPADLDALADFVRNVAAGETHILVVEDDDAQRTNLVEVIMGAAPGVIPLSAASAAQALKIAERMDLDAAVIDVNLPDVSGADLASRLRALSHHDLPVLILTGYRGDWFAAIEELLVEPSVQLIEKPFDVDQLISTVMGMTGRL